MAGTIASTRGEVERVIATADRIVTDPYNLTTRQIVAGQEVPPDLVDAEDADVSIVGHEFENPAKPAASASKAPTPPRPGGGKPS